MALCAPEFAKSNILLRIFGSTERGWDFGPNMWPEGKDRTMSPAKEGKKNECDSSVSV